MCFSLEELLCLLCNSVISHSIHEISHVHRMLNSILSIVVLTRLESRIRNWMSLDIHIVARAESAASSVGSAVEVHA